MIDTLSNSQIENLICANYKSPQRRSILRDRYINNLTYKDILQKYDVCYPAYQNTRKEDKKIYELRKIFMRFERRIKDKQNEVV